MVGKTRSYAISSGEHRTQKTAGYRVQVYAGNNSQAARPEAQRKGEQVKSQFPELQIYTYFTSPRWLCQVGDYRSIEEADAVMRRLRATGLFKEAAIVRTQINL